MSTLNATVLALQYGLPLYSYAKLALPFVDANAVNLLVHSTEIATPQSTIVVLPNVDTLYSTALYDLSQNDLRVTIPNIGPDRYWSFAFYDPFGNDFATLSSIHNHSGREYLLRYVEDGTWGFQPSISGDDSIKYQGYVNSPTIDGTILGRILVKGNNSDVTEVQSFINASSAFSIPRKSSIPASLTKRNLEPYSTEDTALAILKLLANFFDTNPPFNISAAGVTEIKNDIFNAGIYGGSYHQPPGLNLSVAYNLAISALQTSVATVFEPFNNGWYHSVPQGLFGNNYIDRAATAANAYLELTDDQVLYAMTENQQMQLGSDDSYLYTFSAKPPLANDGFWSLTLYNADGYLVGNALNKYAVGDRSNITYPDGTVVYGGNPARSDGSFQVLIQGADVEPPKNWTNNWLPCPSNTIFSTTLRLYAPLAALSDGTYQYPVITKGQAISHK
ncbi:DUF1214-domain-containing protein [Stipitochalara longipes BDJ]|nr:DUF1214-domain-containing protein [Stipitochalara longipes BDJ]